MDEIQITEAIFEAAAENGSRTQKIMAPVLDKLRNDILITKTFLEAAIPCAAESDSQIEIRNMLQKKVPLRNRVKSSSEKKKFYLPTSIKKTKLKKKTTWPSAGDGNFAVVAM